MSQFNNENDDQEPWENREERSQTSHLPGKNALASELMSSMWFWQTAPTSAIDYLQQWIVQASDGSIDPGQALVMAYHRLPEEQKIAFLLSGKAQSLFDNRRQAWWLGQRGATGGSSSQRETGDLPVLC